MTNTIAIILFVVAFLTGCDKAPSSIDWSSPGFDRAIYAHEEGLRAGYADAKNAGVCDHPFPREVSLSGYGALYLQRYEAGYYKACAIARKSEPVPRKSQSRKPTPPPLSRCEAL